MAENEPKGGKKQYGPQHDKERNWKIEFHTKKLAEHRKWGREGEARGKRYGDICIRIADSLFYKAETNTPL